MEVSVVLITWLKTNKTEIMGVYSQGTDIDKKMDNWLDNMYDKDPTFMDEDVYLISYAQTIHTI